ncbi:MAG: site-specific integrase [Verrucomicrobiota bacterium]
MNSGNNEDRLGHNSGAQPHSTPIPKHSDIQKRGSVYYYRKRIPTDLVRAGCYGKKEEIKKSLNTSDLTTAKRLALTVAIEVDEDFESKRKELNRTTPPTANDRNPPAKRKLVDLSEIERRDFIIRAFITSEKEQTTYRVFESDPEIREQMLDTVREDLAVTQGSSSYAPVDWRAEAIQALKAEGISVETADEALLAEFTDKLQRVRRESAWRTEQALNGNRFRTHDTFFRDFDADSSIQPPANAVPPPANVGMTIGGLCREYLTHNEAKNEKGKLRRNTLSKMQIRCRLLTDFFGTARSLNSITDDDAIRMVDFLATIPANAAKRYKGASLIDAAKQEAKSKSKELIHPRTIEDYLTGLVAVLNYAKEKRWLKENPFGGRLISERLPKHFKKKRQPLSPDEMIRVFSSPEFIAHKEQGEDEARFWLPLLCLFHGARADEVAGLRVPDVRNIEDIICLDFHETEERRLKNDHSVRIVPVHKQLIAFKFLDFVKRRREEDADGYLFTKLNQNKNGKRADSVCKWWQRFVTRLLGPAPSDATTGARGIHSLRHSWATAARSAGIDESIRKQLGGWSQDDAAGEYGQSSDALPLLKREIDKIEFPKVDFSILCTQKNEQ